MNRQDKADVCAAVREELRTCALLGEPAGHRPLPPSDLDSEAAVIAAAFEGGEIPASLQPEHFFSELNRNVFIVLATMREHSIAPTVDRIVRAIASCGIVATALEEGVRRTLEGPVCINVERMAERVMCLARRRRAIAKLDYLRALLAEPMATEEQIDAAEQDYRAARDGAST